MASDSIKNICIDLDRHSDILQSLVDTLATVQKVILKIDRKIDNHHYHSPQSPEISLGTLSQKSLTPSNCNCSSMKTEILAAIEQKFVELRQGMIEARHRDINTTDSLMKEIIHSNSDILSRINSNPFDVRNELMDVLKENSEAGKNEILEVVRVQSHHIQSKAKENMTEQFERLKEEIATLSAVVKQTIDFRSETSVLKQILDKSQILITSQKKQCEDIDTRLAKLMDKSDKTLAMTEKKFDDINRLVKEQQKEQEQRQKQQEQRQKQRDQEQRQRQQEQEQRQKERDEQMQRQREQEQRQQKSKQQLDRNDQHPARQLQRLKDAEQPAPKCEQLQKGSNLETAGTPKRQQLKKETTQQSVGSQKQTQMKAKQPSPAPPKPKAYKTKAEFNTLVEDESYQNYVERHLAAGMTVRAVEGGWWSEVEPGDTGEVMKTRTDEDGDHWVTTKWRKAGCDEEVGCWRVEIVN